MKSDELSDAKMPANDLTITIGMGRLCTTSLETIRAVANAVDTPQIERKLQEVARSRELKLAKTIPATYLDQSVAGYAPEFADEAGQAYEKIRRELGKDLEQKLVADLYLADQKAAFLLRRTLKKVNNMNLAFRLSSLIASFQLTNELLKDCAEYRA